MCSMGIEYNSRKGSNKRNRSKPWNLFQIGLVGDWARIVTLSPRLPAPGGWVRRWCGRYPQYRYAGRWSSGRSGQGGAGQELHAIMMRCGPCGAKVKCIIIEGQGEDWSRHNHRGERILLGTSALNQRLELVRLSSLTPLRKYPLTIQ